MYSCKGGGQQKKNIFVNFKITLAPKVDVNKDVS